MKRPFVTMGGSFLFSFWLCSIGGDLLQVLLLITGILCFFVCLGFAPKQLRGGLCMGFLFVGLAAGLFFLRTQQDLSVVEQLPLDQTVELTGTVTDIVPRSNHRYAYYLTVSSMRSTDDDGQAVGEAVARSFRTIVYSERYLDVSFYDQLTLPVSLFLPSDSQAFDSIRYYYARSVRVLGYFSGDGTVPLSVVSPAQKPVGYLLKQHHQRLIQTIDEIMSPEAAAVLRSMVLGDSSGVSDTLREQYVRAGVVHLFAISGMHISILAGFLRLLFGVLFVGRGRRHVGSVLAQMLVLSLFVALTGMRISAVRAGIMILILLLGQAAARRAEGTNSLCFAAFLILLFDPYAIFDLGFLMSFLATLGILTLSTPMSDWCMERLSLSGDLPRLLVQAASISAAANLFLLPVYVTAFQVVPLLFLPANLATMLTATGIVVTGFVLVWVVSVGLWLPIGVGLLESVVPLRPIFFLLEQVISLQNQLVARFAQLPFATMGLDDAVLRLTLLLCGGLVCGAFLLHRVSPPKRHPHLLRLGAMLSGLVLLSGVTLSMRVQEGRVWISVIGDGETSNLVLIKDYQAVVVSPKDSAEIDRRTYRYLRSKGVRRIHTLVLLYEELALYEDTLHLVQNMPVQHILYHRASRTATTLLDGFADVMVAMGHQSEIGIPETEEMKLSVSYYGQLVDLSISCYGYDILLTSHIPTLQQTPTTLALVRGNVRVPLLDLPTRHLVLLQRQWNPITANQPYQVTAETLLELVITPDGVLRSQNRLFLPPFFLRQQDTLEP